MSCGDLGDVACCAVFPLSRLLALLARVRRYVGVVGSLGVLVLVVVSWCIGISFALGRLGLGLGAVLLLVGMVLLRFVAGPVRVVLRGCRVWIGRSVLWMDILVVALPLAFVFAVVIASFLLAMAGVVMLVLLLVLATAGLVVFVVGLLVLLFVRALCVLGLSDVVSAVAGVVFGGRDLSWLGVHGVCFGVVLLAALGGAVVGHPVGACPPPTRALSIIPVCGDSVVAVWVRFWLGCLAVVVLRRWLAGGLLEVDGVLSVAPGFRSPLLRRDCPADWFRVRCRLSRGFRVLCFACLVAR
ncbi:hypothetical protein [Halomonas cupida]|uniref:hypothetical protein n=1 Tax=Halomonas cupida TaxID=44933 RepID=UPI00190F03CF|nr:hypothetical protein [Halomonas cupida]